MMGTFFLVLAALIVFAGVRALRMRRPYPEEVEPWDRAWDDDDEPLDEEEIRAAEDAFWEEGEWEDEVDDEGWRG